MLMSTDVSGAHPPLPGAAWTGVSPKPYPACFEFRRTVRPVPFAHGIEGLVRGSPFWATTAGLPNNAPRPG